MTSSRRRPFALSMVAISLAAISLAAAALSGCVGRYQADFQLIVVNRITNPIAVLANGSELGQVAPGQQSTFNMRLPEVNPNTFTNGVGPTPQGAVTLTARDARSGALSDVKTITLTQGSPTYVTFAPSDFPAATPTVARFTVSPPNPGPNQDVQFNASASTPREGTFAWTFGDGTSGSGATLTHRYDRVGQFLVTLTVTSPSGQTATATSVVNVTTALPGQTVNFTFSPAAPGVNQEIFFNASTSTVQGATFSWDFGDGTTRTGVTTTHRYSRAGTYTVTLRATNATGQSGATSRQVTVSATSPSVTASFTFSPTTPGINQDVFFNASASRPVDGTYTWNFGDGNSGTGINPIHRYRQAGTYTVTLIVSNDVGQSATTTRTVTVAATSTQVFASFVFSPTTPGVNQVVFFDASASRPANGSYNWDFGDGGRGVGITPTHQFAQPGTYTVTLVVSNEFGQSAAASRTITVSASSNQVIANFNFSPADPTVNQDVFFNATGSRPVNATFYWDYGDGTPVAPGLITPVHRYAAAGTYTVTLTVVADTGQLATTSRTVTVTLAPFTADFSFSPTDPSITRGTNTVIFDAAPSSPGATTWTWDFGDGTANETGQRVTHTFTRQGTWVVRLTITRADGRTATTTRNVPVAP